MNWFAKGRAKRVLLEVIRENMGEKPPRTLEGLHRSLLSRLKERAMRRHPFLDWLTGGWESRVTHLYTLPTIDDTRQMLDELARKHRIERVPRPPRGWDELENTILSM